MRKYIYWLGIVVGVVLMVLGVIWLTVFHAAYGLAMGFAGVYLFVTFLRELKKLGNG